MHVPSTRNDEKNKTLKTTQHTRIWKSPPFSFLGNQTQKQDIFEQRDLPVVRALIMPARRPLKSLKTSSTVRGLYCAPPSIALSLSHSASVLVTKHWIPSQNKLTNNQIMREFHKHFIGEDREGISRICRGWFWAGVESGWIGRVNRVWECGDKSETPKNT